MLKLNSRNILKLSVAALGAIASMPAFAAMGSVNCATGDSSLRRNEKEVWGENVVTWTYEGKAIEASQIAVTSDPVVVNEAVRLHPNLGEERLLEDVQKVTLTLPDGMTVDATLLCTSLTYPNAYDF